MKLPVLLAVSLATVSAFAQTNALQVRSISLQECIQGALEKNLEVRVARYSPSPRSPSQARLDLAAAYAGYDPTFLLRGTHDYNRSLLRLSSSSNTVFLSSGPSSDSFRASVLNGLTPWGMQYDLSGDVSKSYGAFNSLGNEASGSAAVTLTQPLLKNFWMDNTRLSIRVAKNRIKYSELGFKYLVLDVIRRTELAYYDVIAAREKVKVQEKAVETAVALLNENNKRVEFGAMTPLDAQDAEAQAASSRATLIQAQQDLGTKLETLKGLISDNFAAWSEVDLVPVEALNTNRQTVDLQKSWGIALRERPDLIQAKLNVERQGITLKYDRNQLFPQLDLVGSYGHNAGGVREFSGAFNQLGNGNQPSYYYGAQISFPIGNVSARATYKQGKLTMESLLLSLKKSEQDIMIAVHNDIGTINANYDNIEATRTARQFAEASLEAEQTKLQNGKSTTFTVLQKQSLLTTSRANEIQALADYNKALAQLGFDEATTFERLRVDLEIK